MKKEIGILTKVFIFLMIRNKDFYKGINTHLIELVA
jgi:hypothetical protein